MTTPALSDAQPDLVRLSYPRLEDAFGRGTLQAPPSIFQRERSLDAASITTPRFLRGFDVCEVRLPSDVEFLDVVKALTPSRFGNCEIYRLAAYHGVMVPLFEGWRLENPETPLHVLNWDTHHDHYKGSQTSATWSRYLSRSANTHVTHFPSHYSLDTHTVGLATCELEVPAYAKGTRWQDLSVGSFCAARCKRVGGEIWISIDLDHFFCFDSVKSLQLPFLVPTKRDIDVEVSAMVDFITANELIVSRVIVCKSARYIELHGKVGADLIRNATTAVVRGFGYVGLFQAGRINREMFQHLIQNDLLA